MKCRFAALSLSCLVLFSAGLTAIAQSSEARLPSEPSRPVIVGSQTAPSVLGAGGSLQYLALPWTMSAAQANSRDEGPAPSSQVLHMTVLLNRSAAQQAALNAYIQATQTPGNPLYQQLLTPAEFTQQFGISTSDLNQYASIIASQGFTIEGADGGRRYIGFTGTVAAAEATFHTQIHTYTATDGSVHYGPVSGPQLPALYAAAVRGITGLDNFYMRTIPNFDGPVSALPPPAGAQAPTPTEGLPAQATPPGVIEFHNGGAVITSSLDPDDNSDGAIVSRRASVIANPNLVSTAMSVSLATNTVNYASTQSDLITGVLSYSGATPTGTITFYDADGYLGVQMLLSACTAGSGTYTCTYNWTAASVAQPSPDTIYAVYSGDSNYNSSTGTTSLTITTNPGGGPNFIGFNSFTDTPNNQPVGAQGPVTVEVESGDVFAFGGGPTGQLLVAGNGGIGSIYYAPTNVQGCIFGFLFCYFNNTFTWHPSNSLLPGVYLLTAAYSGNTSYESAYQDTNYTVTGSGSTPTTTTVTANPNFVSAGSPGTTFTTVTSWSGTAAAPTGNLSVTYAGASIGAAVFPITGATTSIGSGNYDGGTYTFTYSCATTTTGSGGNITCQITDTNIYALLAAGANTITATYYGNTVYHTSSGTTTVTKSSSYTSTTTVVSINPNGWVYGTPETPTITITVAGSGGHGNPTGSIAASISGGVAATTIQLTSCTGTTTKTCTWSPVIPPTTPAGTYTITATYSGSAVYNTSSATRNFTISKATVTIGTGTITPNPVAQGSSTPVVLTGTATWAGSGNPPTSGNFYFLLNGATYNASSCTTTGDSDSCTVTVPAGTIAALPTGSYPVKFGFATDTNYAPATAVTIGTLVINGTGTLTTALSCTANCGTSSLGTTAATLKVTVTNSGGTAPTGTVTITDTNTVYTSPVIPTQTFTVTLVPGAGGVSTATITPSLTSGISGGVNSFSAVYSGNTSVTSNTVNTFYQGLLFTIDLKHNFSTDPGVVEGSPVCNGSNGTPNSTCTTPYVIGVFNFTPATQTLHSSFTNAASGAFSSVTTCGTTLASGASCVITFYYNPPLGDGTGYPGCTPANTCGFYEQATWSVTGNTGTITGIGIPSGSTLTTTRSGPTSFPAILCGKAILKSMSGVTGLPRGVVGIR